MSGSQVVSTYAPGRVELLGNHTDYNDGLVLAGAIDRGVSITGHARDDGLMVLKTLALGRTLELPIAKLERQIEHSWANYVLGVVQELLEAGIEVRGFNAEISSSLPLGGGLSSSAALEVASARFLLELCGARLEPLQLAKLCQRAENQFVGVQSGLLDQITSVFGRANHLVFIDCRTNEVRLLPFPAELSLVLADSGVKHRLIEGEYNARREQCQDAARALGCLTLRDVTASQLQSSSIDPVLKRRAAHIVGENERVLQAVEVLERADTETFGRLMSMSHESSRVNFENSTPELDLLVNIACELPGVLGARLTGGGFGGSTVTLANASHAQNIAERLARDYSRHTGLTTQVFTCRLSDGTI